MSMTSVSDAQEKRAQHAQRPRMLGQGAAARRCGEMEAGQNLPAHKRHLLRMTARLLVHFENASNLVFWGSEVTQEDKPRELLTKALDLQREIRTNLTYIFDDAAAADDVLAKLRKT